MVSGETYHRDDLRSAHSRSERLYHEFLRGPSMSCGLYVLPAGGSDPQGPHTEDEVYVVLRGRARVHIGERDESVGAGSVVFVPATLSHRFHDIEEELEIVVIFAPPEGSRKKLRRRPTS